LRADCPDPSTVPAEEDPTLFNRMSPLALDNKTQGSLTTWIARNDVDHTGFAKRHTKLLIENR
jgi:hypothetical protein